MTKIFVTATAIIAASIANARGESINDFIDPTETVGEQSVATGVFFPKAGSESFSAWNGAVELLETSKYAAPMQRTLDSLRGPG